MRGRVLVDHLRKRIILCLPFKVIRTDLSSILFTSRAAAGHLACMGSKSSMVNELNSSGNPVYAFKLGIL